MNHPDRAEGVFLVTDVHPRDNSILQNLTRHELERAYEALAEKYYAQIEEIRRLQDTIDKLNALEDGTLWGDGLPL